ncbi:alpha/beta fold hydrolase [Mycolicibacterium fluoranthenivorans]|uniref:Alpha/beta fold hydrolase n=1 Tax=Mycolicibacterium fluoranthenivorans TaxID=258505 RepID=A0A7G8PBQ2_9MYCO|nr:alpha/beta fold hydrolase [Mycolicibacterium fluoranthenivorans]QNJ91768.1 alpha/beta fold hydrolase [Mycolicibacterium fluoranthenivorans]
MTELVRRRMVMVGAVPMTALVAPVAEPRAVIVAIHGGATSSVYFDCPGHPNLSLLRRAGSQGFTAIALDRPGYGASALYQDTMDSAANRVALAWGAVDMIAQGGPVFLLGHSLGCELALRMAGHERVIGISLAGTGLRYHPKAKDLLSTATLAGTPTGLRQLLWEPATLYPDGIPSSALSAPGVRYEGAVTSDWARHTFGELAAAVRVPVQFSAADHEGVWESGPESLAAIAALFTGAPGVDVNEMADSGHNLSVGLSAAEYHRRVLAFAGQCVSSAVEAEAG